MRKVCLVALAFVLPAPLFAQTAPASPSPTATQSSPTATQPASTAAAKTHTSKGYVRFHVGGQAAGSSLTDGFTFSQYDETATVTVDEDYGGGFLWNFEGGFRFARRLSAGVAVARAAGDIDAHVSASIPHPLNFDQPRTATIDPGSMRHSETSVHFFAAYDFAASPTLDVRVFAGPSVISTSHDLVSAVAFQEGGAPFTSVSLTGVTIDERNETVAAFHVGAGVTYHLTDRLGVDGFFRFARRTVDITGVGGSTTELKVGGAQFGVGLTYGF